MKTRPPGCLDMWHRVPSDTVLYPRRTELSTALLYRCVTRTTEFQNVANVDLELPVSSSAGIIPF